MKIFITSAACLREMDLCLEKASLVIIKSSFNFEKNKSSSALLDAYDINRISTKMGKKRKDKKAKLLIQTHKFEHIEKVNKLN